MAGRRADAGGGGRGARGTAPGDAFSAIVLASNRFTMGALDYCVAGVYSCRARAVVESY